MEKQGEDLQPSPPSRFSWRTFWIYTGLGPQIGALAGLLLYMLPPLADARTRAGASFTADALAGVVIVSWLLGLILGAAPALATGLLAGRLHRTHEPLWRTLALGMSIGALASPAWLLVMTGFRAPIEMLVFVTLIGAFAGSACALIQRTKSTPHRNS
jgi:hypothetical protein